MRCYKCDTVLSENDFCNNCGEDVGIYKRIINMSNMYYNMGLKKAQIRDLSGAIDCLRRSVKLDKRNTKSRNLLGLVCYEMGEVVEALSQWVISKNLQPEKNIADQYIKAIQSNQTRLEMINQTIKKYNLALNYAKQDSDDLAIIQLKKVLNMNPNLVKGHQLLALLYMKNEENDKARKSINKALKIDANNTLSIAYLKELGQDLPTKDIGEEKKKKNKYEEKSTHNAYDVIIPPSAYKESNTGTLTVINILIGIVIGAAMIFFLITPAKVASVKNEYNDKIKEYDEKIAKINSETGIENAQIEDLEAEIKKLEAELEDAKGQVTDTSIYDNVLLIIDHYIKEEYTEAGTKLVETQSIDEGSESFKALYNSIRDNISSKIVEECYKKGNAAVNNGDFGETAATNLIICYELDPDNPNTAHSLYNGAKSLKAMGDIANADKYYAIIVKDFPNTEQAGWAESNMSAEARQALATQE